MNLDQNQRDVLTATYQEHTQMANEFRKYEHRIIPEGLRIWNGDEAKDLNLPDDNSKLFFMQLIEQANAQHCEPGESPVELKAMINRLAEEIKKLTDHIQVQNNDILKLVQGKNFDHLKAGGKRF